VRTLARRPYALATAWFGVLGLLVAGPVLGGGYVMLLDFVSGPHIARPDPLPVPSSGDVGNTAPLAALHAAIAALASTLPDKLLLLAPVVVGGVGAYRLLASRLGAGGLAALYGGTLYAVNPFVRDRYLAGHLYLLLGCGLLPWALAAPLDLLREATRAVATRAAAWLAVLAAVSLHVAGAYTLLVVLACALAPASALRRISLAAGAAALAAVLCAYWLLPDLVAPPRRASALPDLAEYATRSDGAHPLAGLAALHGFWRDEFPAPAERHPLLFLLVAPLVALAVVGLVALLRSALRTAGILLTVGAFAGLLVAAGTSWSVTERPFRAAVEHVGPLVLYREPQKLVVLVVLAYALLGGVGLAVGLRAAARRERRAVPAAAAAALAIVLAYGSSLFWGVGGNAQLARYPDGWAEAEAAMAQRGSGGALLVLPWRLYGVWSVAPDRILLNPAASYFDREVLASDDPGFAPGSYRSADVFREHTARVLASRRSSDELGRSLAPLDVRFVAVLDGGPDERFVLRQRDLALLHRSPGLVVLENEAWREPLPLGRVAPGPAGVEPPEPDAGPAPLLARALPLWREVEPGGAPVVAVGERCDDGWLLEDAEPRCHLGAVAAFASPDHLAELWRPRAAWAVLGYTLAGLGWAVVAAAAVRRRRAKRAERAPYPLPAAPPRAAVVAAALAGTLLAAYLAAGGSAEESRRRAPAGAACPGLENAAASRRRGDSPAFRAAVRRAADAAVSALDVAGSTAGRPEEAALELASRLEAGAGPDDPEVARLLRQAERTCATLRP
jgi:hypothetical protein